MNFLSSIIFLLFIATLSQGVLIFVDRTSLCSQDCGTQLNPFPSLPLAMFVFDQIIDQDPSYLANYYYISSNVYQNSSVSFILTQNQTYEFNIQELNATRPCDPSTSECLFKYFYHLTESLSYSSIEIKSFNSDPATIKLNTQRVSLFANFTANFRFININFVADFENDECSDCGINTAEYSFISLFPYSKSFYSSQILFDNCRIQNFSINHLNYNHVYSHFIAISAIDNYNYIENSYQNMKLEVIFNNSLIENLTISKSLFSLSKGYLHIVETKFRNIQSENNRHIFMDIEDLFLENVFFYNTPFVANLSHSSIHVYNAIFNSIYSSSNVFEFPESVNATFENISVQNSGFAYFLNFLYNNNLTSSNLIFSSLDIQSSLLCFDYNNNVKIMLLHISNIVIQSNVLKFLNSNTIFIRSFSISGINSQTAFGSLFSLYNSNILSVFDADFLNLYNFISIYVCIGNENFINILRNTLKNYIFNPNSFYGAVLSVLSDQNQIDLQNISLSDLNKTTFFNTYSFFQCNVNCTITLKQINVDIYEAETSFVYVIYFNEIVSQAIITNLKVTVLDSFNPLSPERMIYNVAQSSSLNYSGSNITTNEITGYYVDEYYYLKSCGSGCQKCSNNTYCTSCNSSSVLSNGVCQNSMSICGAGNYYDYYLDSCRNCTYGCEDCFNSNICNNCYYGFALIYNGSYCSRVFNCFEYVQNNCTQCYYGYYLIVPNVCYPCNRKIQGCNTCSNDGLNCYSCDSGYFLKNQTVNNSEIMTCLQCNSNLSNCRTCNNESFCNVCEEGYLSINGVCLSCDQIFPNCKSCNISHHCTDCSEGYYLKNEICVANQFTITFPDEIIGQFYNFFSKQCLSFSSYNYFNNNSQYNTNKLFVPCTGIANSETLFKIKRLNSHYIIKPLINTEALVSAECNYHYSDYSPHYLINARPATFFENSTKATSSNNSTENSTNGTSTNITDSCLDLNKLSCNSSNDIYNYYLNSICYSNYNNQTSLWNLQLINDPLAFGDSKFSFLLRNIGLNNLCLSYSDGFLEPCDSNSFNFTFGFKIIDSSQVINQISSNLSHYQNVISIQWIDPLNSYSRNYFLYYFDNSIDFKGYVCGSNKADSPVMFNYSFDSNGSSVISTNLTLNDLINCGCRTYEDSKYIYFDVKAGSYDNSSKFLFVDFYHVKFFKMAEYDQAIYAGYTSDSENSQGEIFETNRNTTEMNVSSSLTVQIENLISNKYLMKNASQSILIKYASNNKFKMNLLNGTVSFIIANKVHNLNASSSNNNTNEITISFDLSSLASGYYNLKFGIYFQMSSRLLAENNVEPNNFTSSYVSSTSFFVGTSQEITEKQQEDLFQSGEKSDLDVKMLIIGLLAGAIGLLVVVGAVVYLTKRWKVQTKKKRANVKQTNEENSDIVREREEDRSPVVLIRNMV